MYVCEASCMNRVMYDNVCCSCSDPRVLPGYFFYSLVSSPVTRIISDVPGTMDTMVDVLVLGSFVL